MASLSSSVHPLPSGLKLNRRPKSTPVLGTVLLKPLCSFSSSSSSSSSNGNEMGKSSTSRGRTVDMEKLKEKEAKERKEEVNRKIASKKAISVILRREATKVLIEKKRGPTNSKKLLPRTVLEALYERISALRWESALKVSLLFVFIFSVNLKLLIEFLTIYLKNGSLFARVPLFLFCSHPFNKITIVC